MTAAMQVLHDSRHGPYRTVGVFFVPRFFSVPSPTTTTTCFLQLSLTIAPTSCSILSGRSRPEASARPARGPVERRFLIEFSSIFMKILACRLAGHPVTFLAMLDCRCDGAEAEVLARDRTSIDLIRNYGPGTRDGALGFRPRGRDGDQLQFRSRRVRSVAM